MERVSEDGHFSGISRIELLHENTWTYLLSWSLLYCVNMLHCHSLTVSFVVQTQIPLCSSLLFMVNRGLIAHHHIYRSLFTILLVWFGVRCFLCGNNMSGGRPSWFLKVTVLMNAPLLIPRVRRGLYATVCSTSDTKLRVSVFRHSFAGNVCLSRICAIFPLR